MKTFLKFFKIFLLMSGVFAAETDEGKTVMEGDSVTLNPDLTQIQGFIQMLWRFGDPGPVIAQNDENVTSYTSHDRFRDRLQLNQMGSLIIKNMRTTHSGLYKLEINHRTGTSYKTSSVTVYESPSVIDAVEVERQLVSVMEGDSVALDVPQLQGNELIVWRSGDEGKLIAKTDKEAKSSLLYDIDERFRDRLKLDNQTGSLIITNTRTTDSGLYKVKISSNKQTLYKRFTVTVSAVPDPGLSQGAVAGIVLAVLVSAAVAAGVMYYRRPRTTTLPSQTWSVSPGDHVTLNPETDIQKGDEIQWLFGAADTLIAQIRRENRGLTTYEGPDGIFGNRLKLDKTTGSLTIKLNSMKHTGLYTLKIRRGRETLYKRFMVSVELRKRPVTEGDDVTLDSNTEIQTHDEIQWLFDDKEQPIVLAEIKTTGLTKYEGTDERFRDRLKLDKETGSLIITEFTAKHAGYYTVKSRRGRETLNKRFYIYAKVRKIEVTERADVTLKPATEINKDDSIQWLFSDEGQQTVIAEIKGETEVFTHDDAAGGRFRDRLELDKTTGSLTIKNTRTSHSGHYRLQIRSSSEVSTQTFFVTVNDKVEKKFLNKGDSVTLNTGVTEIQRDDQILWMFGAQANLIAQIKGGTVEIYDDDANKRFKDRLKLNKTGSLTITNIRTEHKGLYKLQTISSSSREILFKKFKVSIRSRKKSEMKKNDSTGYRLNESATVEMPLLNGDDLDGVNEEEGTSSL